MNGLKQQIGEFGNLMSIELNQNVRSNKFNLVIEFEELNGEQLPENQQSNQLGFSINELTEEEEAKESDSVSLGSEGILDFH